MQVNTAKGEAEDQINATKGEVVSQVNAAKDEATAQVDASKEQVASHAAKDEATAHVNVPKAHLSATQGASSPRGIGSKAGLKGSTSSASKGGGKGSFAKPSCSYCPPPRPTLFEISIHPYPSFKILWRALGITICQWRKRTGCVHGRLGEGLSLLTRRCVPPSRVVLAPLMPSLRWMVGGWGSLSESSLHVQYADLMPTVYFLTTLLKIYL